MNRISRELLSIAREINALDETNIANKKGVYHNFNGKIEWGDTNGYVKSANFQLDYGSFSGKPHGPGIIWDYGIWIDGTWHNGQWDDGIWENGTWLSGAWHNGTWKNGTWENGEWIKGIWENGTWKNGKWYKDKREWINGIWKNGTWINGEEASHFGLKTIKHGNGDSPDKWGK